MLENSALIINHLQQRIPKLMAIYAFGSRVAGTHHAQSDLDLAVLVAGYADALLLFEVAQELADKLGMEVDLLDARAASTVMQHQIFTTGVRLWAQDIQADLFELAMLSEKFYLDEWRKDLINDIRQRGSVYGG